MNINRFMVQGRTFAAALVKGFLSDATSDDDAGEIVSAEITIEGFPFSVDPRTIEPVALPVSVEGEDESGVPYDFWSYRCPNCGDIICQEPKRQRLPVYTVRVKYCPDCGQRILWGERNVQ
jgi:DNA-directed RNA polymerase subunit RPC12/RpoP